MDFETKIIDIIVEEFVLFSDEIDLEKDLVDDLGMDSLDVMCVAIKIEEVFNIDFPDEDVEEIRTGQDFVDYLHKRLD